MTRKRRYLISAAVLAACVCIAIGVLAMLPPQPGVTKANFDRVKPGMTLAEVEQILGPTVTNDPESANNPICVWQEANGAGAVIFFSKERLTTDTLFNEPTETFTDKLRRWLHLPK